jgi:hypothetical protein
VDLELLQVFKLRRGLLTQSLLVLVVQVLQLLTIKQIIQEVILYLAVLHLLAEVAQVITKALVLLAVLAVAVDGLVWLAVRVQRDKVLRVEMALLAAQIMVVAVVVVQVRSEPTVQLLQAVTEGMELHLLILVLQ